MLTPDDTRLDGRGQRAARSKPGGVEAAGIIRDFAANSNRDALITHLSEQAAMTVMQTFFEKIKSGGIGVVTTYGVCSRKRHDEGWSGTVWEPIPVPSRRSPRVAGHSQRSARGRQ
ncbi:hypothetical protein ACXIVK_00360 [Paraburkholderia caledonica]